MHGEFREALKISKHKHTGDKFVTRKNHEPKSFSRHLEHFLIKGQTSIPTHESHIF